MTIAVVVASSPRSKNKYQAIISNTDGSVKTVHFGDSRYTDFTDKNKSAKSKARYLARHERNQDWSLNGLETAGFWSRYLLWNQRSIAASVRDLNRRFFPRIKVKLI